MPTPYLSIIVPAYNEARRISRTLLDMDDRLRDASFSYEIIVVNDGSRDGTVDVVQGLMDRVKSLRLLDYRENKGKGAAVRAGMLHATGTMRLVSDADNSTSIDQFEAMMPFLNQGYDVVIGSRSVPGAKLEPAEPWHRRLVGRGLNFVVRTLLLPGIRDTQCGFKVFTANAAEHIFGISSVNGWGFDVEVLALAKQMKYRIKEIPVHWVNDTRSHVTWLAGFIFLRDIAKVRLLLWKGEHCALSERRGLDSINL